MDFDDEDAELLIRKFVEHRLVKELPDVSKEDLTPDSQRLGDAFNCSICTRIVVAPSECPKCQTAFCGACLGDWRLKN